MEVETAIHTDGESVTKDLQIEAIKASQFQSRLVWLRKSFIARSPFAPLDTPNQVFFSNQLGLQASPLWAARQRYSFVRLL